MADSRPPGEDIDVAARVRPPPLEDSGAACALAELGQHLVAGAGLLERPGGPGVPADLARHPSLGPGPLQQQLAWHSCGSGGVEARIEHRPRFITCGPIALGAAAVAGVGVLQPPGMMASEELERGELIDVLSGSVPRREIVHAMPPSRRGMLPWVRAVADLLAEEFRELEDDRGFVMRRARVQRL